MQLAFAGGAALGSVERLAAPAKPHPASLAQRFGKRHGKAAGGHVARVCDTVGYRYESWHMLVSGFLCSCRAGCRERGVRGQITVSQGADSRIAPLISPTIE
ncbi:hypothetical protein D3C72_1921870 [compost metagenome]